MALTTVTIQGTYQESDGTPASGTVEFTISARSKSLAENLLLPRVPVVGTLNGSGFFSVILVATDQSVLDPTNLTYKVTERINGARTASYNIEVPVAAGGTTLELADIAPIPPAPPIPAAYTLLATFNAHAADASAHGAAAALSAHNTSPSAHSALIPKSIVDAKGDLIVGTADNTVARLPVGIIGRVLTVDPSTATGLRWVDPTGGGGGGASVELPWVNARSFAATSAQADAFGVYNDYKTLGNFYGSLVAAQADYPHAQSLSDSLNETILQAAFNGCIESGSPTTTRRKATAWLYVPPGYYDIVRGLSLTSVQYFRLFAGGIGRTVFRLAGAGSGNYGLQLNGVSYSYFGGFDLAAVGSGEGAINLHWNNTQSLNSTTFDYFHDISIYTEGGTLYCGVAVGTDNTLQNDSITFSHCNISGNWDRDESNTTTWFKGVAMGSASGGNTLDLHFNECTVSRWHFGYSSGGANYHVRNFQHALNGVDFSLGTPGGEVSIQGGRSEGAMRLAVVGTAGVSAAGGSFSLRDIQFSSNELHDDGRWVICSHPGLTMSNVACNPSPRTVDLHAVNTRVKIELNQSAGGGFVLSHIKAPELIDDALLINSSSHGVVEAFIPTTDDDVVDETNIVGFRAYAGGGTGQSAANFMSAGNGSGYLCADFFDKQGNLVATLRDNEGFFFGQNEDIGLKRRGPQVMDVCRVDGLLGKIRSNHLGPTISHSGGALSIDASLGEIFQVNLTGNVTSLTINNLAVGQLITFLFSHTGGPFTVAYPSNIIFAGGQGFGVPPAPPAVPNSMQCFTFVWDGFELIEVAAGSVWALRQSLFDAAGDLLVGTGDNALTRLPVGATNGHVLTVDGTLPAKIKWAAPSGGGGGTDPWLIDIDCLVSPIDPPAGMNFAQSGSYLYGGAMNSWASADEMGWDVSIPAGTWTLELVHVKDASWTSPMTFKLDGTSIGTITNNDATAANNHSTITGIVVSSGGKKRLSIAFPSGCMPGLQHIQLRRTA